LKRYTVLGGLLVTSYGWRWIFFINLPVGAFTFVIIPGLRSGLRHRLDLRGVTLASLALLAICYGLIEGQRYDWGTISGIVSIPLTIGVGAALTAAFLADQALRQRGQHEPLIPFKPFRDRNFTLMNWVSATLAIGMLGVFLGFTIYLQDVLGYSALKAGLTLLPSSLASILAAPVVGKLTDKTGGKYILVAGLSLFAAAAAGPCWRPGPAQRGTTSCLR
jgi:MFS family permease